jgi:hypothetical protein
MMLLYFAGKLKAKNIVSFLIILGFSFIVPLYTMVFIIPVFLLVVFANYKTLSSKWGSLNNITIS